MLTHLKKGTDQATLVVVPDTMIEQLQQYQLEALHCEPITLATILNPKSQIQLFEKHYPDYVFSAKKVISDCLFRKQHNSTRYLEYI